VNLVFLGNVTFSELSTLKIANNIYFRSSTLADGAFKGESDKSIADRPKIRLPKVQGGDDVEPDIKTKRETVRKV